MARSSQQDTDNEQNTKNSPLMEVLSWVGVIVAAMAIAWFLTEFIILNVTVPSGSMESTIMTGDRLFGLRLTYVFSEPQRGDIAVFIYPVDEAVYGTKTKYIKRIIGLPGETVEIRDGKIYIDGSDTPLEEDYINGEWLVANDGFTFEVPEDSYLMLGDNRNNSSDSRYWATIAMNEFAEEGVTLTAEEAMSYSYVKRGKILGKAYVRYWPLNTISWLY